MVVLAGQVEANAGLVLAGSVTARAAGASLVLAGTVTANPNTTVVTIRRAGVWVPARVYLRRSGAWVEITE